MAAAVSHLLIDWYRNSYRDLPWRKTRDPYRIYLSEIILQQTRVEQGLPYYERILEHYPNVHRLADASEDELLSLWQGLGYYSRARNMHRTARHISSALDGRFPDTYAELLQLRGVGPYTAAAIASFAFGLPEPVIDGNVQRVVSRLAGIEDDLNERVGMEQLKKMVNHYFDPEQPALFNQAVMELGALICTPAKPDCANCPLAAHCWARQHGAQQRLPYKGKRNKVKDVEFHYLLITDGIHCLAEQRLQGIWQKLYQFPLVEGPADQARLLAAARGFSGRSLSGPLIKSYEATHLLSHRRISAHFYTIHSPAPIDPPKSPIFELRIDELGNTYPVPVLIDRFLKHREETQHGK